jgi:hypothetical protein
MHFRGGDAFDTVDIEPGYWPPPLAYDLAAFERERPKRVWLVFEDRRNPTIAAADETLRLRGVEVLLQSGALADDPRVLLSARWLVASIGTLALAVGMLSPRIDTFSQFSGPPNPVLKLKGLRIVRAQDVKGEAVQANWGARPEQLAMILSYPIDALQIEAAGPA